MSLPETFVTSIAQQLEVETCCALLQPWSGGGRAPAGTMVPSTAMSEAELDDAKRQAALLAKAAQGRPAVLVPCTLDTAEQEQAAKVLIPVLARTGTCVIAVLLVQALGEMTRESRRTALCRCRTLMQLGAADVVAGFHGTPAALDHKVRVILATFAWNASRTQELLEQEGKVSEEQFKELRSRYYKALWVDVPRLMMPNLPQLDQRLVETSDRVGRFILQLVVKESSAGKSWEATSEAGQRTFFIRTTNKNDLTTATDLERMYREFSFLSGHVRHPHIVKCLEVLNGRAGLHFVFEHVRGKPLALEVATQDGQRLPVASAMECFRQIGSAVARCHAKTICHRCICLDHILA